MKFFYHILFTIKIRITVKFQKAIRTCNKDLDKIFLNVYIENRGDKKYTFELHKMPLTQDSTILATGEDLLNYVKITCASSVSKDSFLVFGRVKRSKLNDVQLTLNYDLLNSLQDEKHVQITNYVYDNKILKEAIMKSINIKNNIR